MYKRQIYNTIEEQIAPKYYARDTDGIPHEWVSSVKRCVADIASNFTTNRMLTDYENRFYDKLAARKREMSAEAYRMAREIAAWKRKVSAAWDQVRIVDVPVSYTHLDVYKRQISARRFPFRALPASPYPTPGPS